MFLVEAVSRITALRLLAKICIILMMMLVMQLLIWMVIAIVMTLLRLRRVVISVTIVIIVTTIVGIVLFFVRGHKKGLLRLDHLRIAIIVVACSGLGFKVLHSGLGEVKIGSVWLLLMVCRT